MTKFLPLVVMLLGIINPFGAFASHLSPEAALARLRSEEGVPSSAKMRCNDGVTLQECIGGLYVFATSNGFMIMPDDDAAPALLAYSDAGKFCATGNPALASWLDFYNRELSAMKSSNLRNGVGVFKVRRKTSGLRTERRAIAPLIKTEWNQEAPYNMLCPKVDGHEVVTGCVATAMAQFMKYYNYPPKGKGSHSYYWEVGKDTLTYDYDTVPFQWDAMTDTYDSKSSEASKEAVAQLMLACGISVDMHYDIGDSGAATTHMGTSLIDIFGYSKSLWMAHRDYYGYDEWIGMIYDELAAGRPVLYSGQGTAGGHQFICDGYQGDGYFHFNWGWGGLSNGYFLLTALNPADLGVGGGAGGFNTYQIATLSARPAQDGDLPTYIVYNSGGFTPDTTTVKAGDDLRCGEIYFNFSMSALPNGSSLGMKFTNAANDSVEYVKGPDMGGLHLDEGRYYDVVKFPELADGTYYITPALHADNKWEPVKMPVGTPDRITAVVQNGVATLSTSAEASIAITDVEIPDTIYIGKDCPMSFTAYNEGSLEYYGNVTPYLFNYNGEAIASSTYRPMDVLPSGKEVVSDYVANFTAVSGQTFDKGNYLLVICNIEGEGVSQPVGVYVDSITAATIIKIADFKLKTDNPVQDPSKVEFSFILSCDSGVYYSCPHVLIFPGDGGYDVGDIGGDNHYLTAGESTEITLTGDLEKLDDGNYIAAVYDNGKEQTDFIRFEIKRVETGIDAVNNEATQHGLIYDTNGMLCTPPLRSGIYIINGHTVIIR